jgi:hypothetical protein
VSVDAVLSIVRFARRIASWYTSIAARCVRAAPSLLVGGDWKVWADAREADALISEHYGWTREAVSALFDVHGYQILNQGLFSEYRIHGSLLLFFALGDFGWPFVLSEARLVSFVAHRSKCIPMII